MNALEFLGGLVLSLATRSAASADILHVPADFNTIQEAIDAAVDGCEVRVADGMFVGPGNIGLDFAGKLILVRSANGPADCVIDCGHLDRAFNFHTGETAEAIVDGFTIRNGLVNEDNGGAILCVSSSPTIRECNFVDNAANGTSDFIGWGGAIHCEGSHPTISNCEFTGNTVTGSGADTAAGAAIACLNGASPAIDQCVFTANTASGADGVENSASGLGGAIAGKEQCAPTITNCQFTGNVAEGAPNNPDTGIGGAIALAFGSNATVSGCTFDSNSAIGVGTETGLGGAIFILSCDPIVEDSSFRGNTVNIAGGAIWIQQSAAEVNRCDFEGNSGQSGGAIANFFVGNPTITDCSFRENSVESEDPLFQQLIGGGAVASVLGSNPVIVRCEFVANSSISGVGGAVSTSANSESVIVNCVFRDNDAAIGGGAVNTGPLSTPLDAGGTTLLVNCLLACNTTPGQGGAVFNDRSVLSMVNCTVVANTAGATGGGVANTGFASEPSLHNCVVYGNVVPASAGSQLSDALLGFTTASYCLIEGGWPGINILDADPVFVDPNGPDGDPATCDDNDYRLALGSPVIDAGNNFALPSDAADLNGDGDVDEPTPLDLDDVARRIDDHCSADTGNGAPPIVDMGAYESPAVIDACDCNDNGITDSKDIANGTSSDFNGNGIPDECESMFEGMAFWIQPLGGLFRLASNWEPGTPGASNGACFDLDATSTVTFDQDAENNRLIVKRGDVTFEAEGRSPYLYELNAIDDASITVGQDAGRQAALTIRHGHLRGSGNATIGRGPGAEGAINVIGPEAVFTSEQSICVGCFGTGTLLVDGGGRVLNRDAVIGDQPESSGSVIVRGDGSIWEVPFFINVFRGTLQVEHGASVVAGIDPFSGVFFFGDGTGAGDGLIDASVVNFGSVQPSIGAGPLTISQDYLQEGQIPGLGADTGSIAVQIGGLAPGIEHGQLFVMGDAVLGGGLFAELTGDFEPAAGDSFVVVGAGTVESRFDVAFLPALPGTLFMRVQYHSAPAGTESVVLVVEDLENLFGGFDDPEEFDLTGPPTGVVLEDLNGDTFPDLAITIPDTAPSKDGTVLIVFNIGTDGDGNWLGFGDTQQVTVGREPSDITAGLFDGDAALDLAVTNSLDDSVTVLINDLDGSGTFVTATIPAVGLEPLALAAGDFTKNEEIDLAVALGGSDEVVIFENDGDANFTQASSFPVGARPCTVDPEDIDDDKDTDIIVCNCLGSSVSVGRLEGGLAIQVLEIPVGAGPEALTVVDLDQNDLPDIVTANRADGTASIVLNDGAGSFRPSVDLPVGSDPRSVTGIDLEGDGDLDIALIANDDAGNAVVQLLRNDLNNGMQLTFADVEDVPAGTNPVFVVAGDLDQDESEDLVTVNEGIGGGSPGPDHGAVNALLNICIADFNGDDEVGFADLIAMLLAWGPCKGCPEDLDRSGDVDFADLIALLSSWGPCS